MSATNANARDRGFTFSAFKNVLSPGGREQLPMINAQVWVPDETACFVLATVVEVSDKGVVQAKINSTDVVVSGTDFHTFDEKDVSESDLVQMLFIDTPNILNTCAMGPRPAPTPRPCAPKACHHTRRLATGCATGTARAACTQTWEPSRF